MTKILDVDVILEPHLCRSSFEKNWLTGLAWEHKVTRCIPVGCVAWDLPPSPIPNHSSFINTVLFFTTDTHQVPGHYPHCLFKKGRSFLFFISSPVWIQEKNAGNDDVHYYIVRISYLFLVMVSVQMHSIGVLAKGDPRKIYSGRKHTRGAPYSKKEQWSKEICCRCRNAYFAYRKIIYIWIDSIALTVVNPKAINGPCPWFKTFSFALFL